MKLPADQRAPAERDKLRAFFLATAAPEPVRTAHDALVAALESWGVL